MLYSLELRTETDTAKVVLHGAAVGIGPDRFRDMLRALTSLGISQVIVDLHHLPSIDIHAAAALSRASRTLSAQNGSLRIAGAREPVATTLGKFGVTHRVEMFPSSEQAGWSTVDAAAAKDPGQAASRQ